MKLVYNFYSLKLNIPKELSFTENKIIRKKRENIFGTHHHQQNISWVPMEPELMNGEEDNLGLKQGEEDIPFSKP